VEGLRLMERNMADARAFDLAGRNRIFTGAALLVAPNGLAIYLGTRRGTPITDTAQLPPINFHLSWVKTGNG
jgi:hypothetical protein